jgi:hypothetical protein
VLSDCGLLNLILGSLNYLVVAATFQELVVVVEEKIVVKAAMMIVPIEIAELGLGLAEDP